MTTPASDRNKERMRFLQRRFRARCKPFRGPVAAVALLNLVLLVVMFVLLEAPFVLRPGVTVNLPSAPFVSGIPYNARVLTITQEGLIFFDDEQVSLDGLQSALARMVYERPGASLVIEADSRVQQAVLVRVYNVAMAVGVREVLLATRAATPGGTP